MSTLRRTCLSPLLGDRGAAIVEFALVIVPLFVMAFGVIELGMIFVANLCLANATMNVARQVRVGSVILPGSSVTSTTGSQMSLSSFKTAVCAGIPLLPNATCLNQLQVDVRTQSTFGGETASTPLSSQNFSTSGFCFYSGVPGNIVTMHVYLVWPLLTPGISSALSNATSLTTSSGTSSGTFYVLVANEVFKNEPNVSSTNTGNGC